MVTICTKKFTRPTIQDIVLDKIRKRQETEDLEEFFRKLKAQREQGNVRVLSGTAVPNSTFKSLHSGKKQEGDGSELSIKDTSDKNNMSASLVVSPQSRDPSQKSLTQNVQEGLGSVITVKSEARTSSLLSGTSTMEELKELRDLLYKSSYVPKQTRTRRPTIEKIKSAIHIIQKQSQNDKNESTINNSFELSDASTSTQIRKKKRVKSKKNVNSVKVGSSSTSRSIKIESSIVKEGKKGKKRKKKTKSKINMEVQCSILEVTTNA